eukprot:344974-Chlamydomonas_euryale.AAC.1
MGCCMRRTGGCMRRMGCCMRCMGGCMSRMGCCMRRMGCCMRRMGCCGAVQGCCRGAGEGGGVGRACGLRQPSVVALKQTRTGTAAFCARPGIVLRVPHTGPPDNNAPWHCLILCVHQRADAWAPHTPPRPLPG